MKTNSYKIVNDFMKEKCVKWSDCVRVCMDAACVMAGYKGELQALIKRSTPEAMWTHCMIYREAPAMKELCPELSDVMDTVIRSVNYI
jgi:Fe-S-cluster-containing hydrogenase component 2